MADNIGRQIAEANQAPEPEQVAAVIVKNLFDNGPARLDGKHRYIATMAIKGALVEWKKQLLTGTLADVEKWKSAYREAKMEMEEVKTRNYILEREAAGK